MRTTLEYVQKRESCQKRFGSLPNKRRSKSPVYYFGKVKITKKVLSNNLKLSYGVPCTKLEKFHQTFFEAYEDAFVDQECPNLCKPPSRQHLQELR